MPLVNEQITDAVTQTNVKVVAESPAMAMSTIYQSMAQATALAAEQTLLTIRLNRLVASANLVKALGGNVVFEDAAKVDIANPYAMAAGPKANFMSVFGAMKLGIFHMKDSAHQH